MTLAALRKHDQRLARAHELRSRGLSRKEVAVRLGITDSTAKTRLQRARELLRAGAKPRTGNLTHAESKALDERLTRYGRCTHCSLWLPCVCIGGAVDLATSRPGAGPTMPEGGF